MGSDSSLEHFTKTLEEAPLPASDLTALLDQKGKTALKSINGCLSYGTGNRPDMAGRVAVSQQNGGADPTVRDLKYANTQLREMRDHIGAHTLRYPRLDETRLSLTGVFDSSHKSVDSKYAQGAYIHPARGEERGSERWLRQMPRSGVLG